MMTIEPYQGDVDALHQRLIDDYTELNDGPPNQWEWSFYLEQLQDSIDNKLCYTCGESIIAVNEGRLFYCTWKDTDRVCFLFLLYVLNTHHDLRIQPLGRDFMGMTFLMNRVSIQKYHANQVPIIRLDFERYDVLDLAVYANG